MSKSKFYLFVIIAREHVSIGEFSKGKIAKGHVSVGQFLNRQLNGYIMYKRTLINSTKNN